MLLNELPMFPFPPLFMGNRSECIRPTVHDSAPAGLPIPVGLKPGSEKWVQAGRDAERVGPCQWS